MYATLSKSGCLLLLMVLLLTSACAAMTPLIGRNETADRIARDNGFEKSFIKTKSFTLTAYCRCAKPGDTLNLYIEGDGSAWLSRTRLSDDPTPRRPLVLDLAAMDPAANVAYLSRPGQYTAKDSSLCDPSYWSDKRFSSEVVDALDEAIEALRTRTGATRINLIGYSGGAALAALIAVKRSDVVSLRTVAGNLDPEAVNRYHNVSPLNGSLNPMDAAVKLKGLPQRHFVGSKDAVVPPFIAQSFMKRAGDQDEGKITIVEGASHANGWRERWKSLLAIPF
jgi:hypothetical protein